MEKVLGECSPCSLLHETFMEPFQSWVFLLSVKGFTFLHAEEKAFGKLV